VHRVSVEPPVLTAEQLKLQALVLKYGQDNTDGEKLRDGGIAGVSCEHFRSVTTTPAGAKGNKLPIKSTIEDCIAHDIGNLHILRVWDSALSGRTEYKFIKFTRGEPDRSLFEPPPSYTILELPIKPANAASAVSPQ
jgi:hypothetical protein